MPMHAHRAAGAVTQNKIDTSWAELLEFRTDRTKLQLAKIDPLSKAVIKLRLAFHFFHFICVCIESNRQATFARINDTVQDQRGGTIAIV